VIAKAAAQPVTWQKIRIDQEPAPRLVTLASIAF
jgi:hypothetical protein